MTVNVRQRAKVVATRQWGKTLMLFSLIFVLGVVLSGAVSVQNAVMRVDLNLRRHMRPIVSFDINWEMSDAHWDEFGEEPLEGFLTPEMVHEMAELPQVAHFVYFVETGGMSTALMQYFYGRSDQQADEGGEWITLHGTSTTDLIQVTEGLVALTQGRTFTVDELTTRSDISPALISERFARLNQLSLGSTFMLDVEVIAPPSEGDDFDFLWYESEASLFASETFEFEVIGIFNVAEVDDFEDHPLNADEREMLLARERHRIETLSGPVHVPNRVAQEMQRFTAEHRAEAFDHFPDARAWMNQDGFADRVITMMLLNDPLEIDAFSEAAGPLLPSEFWHLTYLRDDFDHVSTAMENMRHVANWILWGSAGAAVWVLSLLMMLFLRDRRHEIGVYLALGEKRAKIISQILVEIVVIASVGISLAVFVGHRASEMMTRELLRIELLAPGERQWQDPLGRMGFMQSAPTIYPEELVEMFDVSLNAQTLATFYGIGLGTVVLSTVVPVFYIVRLNPKKILIS